MMHAIFQIGFRLSRLVVQSMLLSMLSGIPLAWAAENGRQNTEASGRLEHVLQRGRLIVGVKTDYPPWGMRDASGEIVGLEPDLARDLADRLGVGLDLVPVTASNRLQLLEQGRIDVVIATMGDTAERRGISDLLQPHYYSSGVGLLTRDDSPFSDWGQLRGRTICLVDGAYFNRALVERTLLTPLIFKGNRDAMLALRDGRCAGWAFDDTVLAQIIRSGDMPGYSLTLPTILATPWAIAVRSGERDAPLGVFVEDAIADWQRQSVIVRLQQEWGLPPSEFLIRQAERWSSRDASGAWICARDPSGAYPDDCLSDRIVRNGNAAANVPSWAVRAGDWVGLSPDLFFDVYARDQLAHGVRTTVLLSGMSILGALLVGVVFGWLDAALARAGALGGVFRVPLQVTFALARMTPPILQLYLFFFALGAIMANSYAISPGAFLTALFVFSLYAGSANAVLISQSLLRLKANFPDRSIGALLPEATEQVFDGLMASCVNIVKAAGMASTIAVAEVISVSNTLIAEGSDSHSVMNFLLVFYFFFVLAVVWLFRRMRHWLVGRSKREEQRC